ncbi:hypothetical protein M1145_00635 [Patescibacteria group bacterium]|nr:hypothetical protein [Patescibacteria group bacterium]
MEKGDNFGRDNFRRKATAIVLTVMSVAGLYAITKNPTQENSQKNKVQKDSTEQLSLIAINKAPFSQEQLLKINPQWTRPEKQNGTAAILSNGTNNVLFILESVSQSKKDSLFRSFRNNPNNENGVNVNFETPGGQNLYIQPVVSMQSDGGNVEYRIEYTDNTGEINNTIATSGIKVTISSNSSMGTTVTQNFHINP